MGSYRRDEMTMDDTALEDAAFALADALGPDEKIHGR
jgi:hypothetical protein